MSRETLSQQIERMARQRQDLWLNGADPVEVSRLTDMLEDAYADRRSERARSSHGSRKDIFRRARIEFELEKLMQPSTAADDA